jgi:hypothetical protein
MDQDTPPYMHGSPRALANQRQLLLPPLAAHLAAIYSHDGLACRFCNSNHSLYRHVARHLRPGVVGKGAFIDVISICPKPAAWLEGDLVVLAQHVAASRLQVHAGGMTGATQRGCGQLTSNSTASACGAACVEGPAPIPAAPVGGRAG